ncbi:MAG: acylphosphatase [Candidatus Dormibacteraceae bacterium]
MKAERLYAIIYGRVQAVGFRAFVYQLARSRDLSGWVRNGSDGTVECIVEGPRLELDRLLEELKQGAPAAQVKEVKADFSPAEGNLGDFEVRF